MSYVLIAETDTDLTLTPDDPIATTITTSIGEILYQVLTGTQGGGRVTQVRNACNEVIGSLGWGAGVPDKVLVGNSRKPISMPSWMKKSAIPFD